MGFIPGTKGEDSDPLYTLEWMDLYGSAGVLVECRFLDVMQEKNKKPERNDRFLFTVNASHEYEDVRSVHDLSAVEKS